MEEGLLLDRVGMHRTGISINQTVIFSIPVFPHPAKSSLPPGDAALMGTELAPYVSSLKWCIKRREFRLDEPLLHPLGLRSLGRAGKTASGEKTKTLATELQNLPSRHLEIRN
jgi:hypothetical protein